MLKQSGNFRPPGVALKQDVNVDSIPKFVESFIFMARLKPRLFSRSALSERALSLKKWLKLQKQFHVETVTHKLRQRHSLKISKFAHTATITTI